MKTELLYGIHPVFEALRANRRQVFEIYFDLNKRSERIDQIASAAEARGIARKNVESSDLHAFTGTAGHQGVAAKVGPYPTAAVSDLLRKAGSGAGNQFLLMLDNIMDPQNLGAIIRTAVCVGIDGVIIPKDRSALPTPAVSRASAGALEHILLARVTNMVRAGTILKENGVWIIGLEKNADQSIYACDLTGSIAVVIGGEQRGIRPLVKTNCDFLVSIPQQGPLDSLNASVAAAVAMYESFRQRQQGKVFGRT